MKKILLAILPIFIIFVGLELGSRLFINKPNQSINYYDSYTSVELDTELPFARRQNGGQCTTMNLGFKWDQWWGKSQKSLDSSCAAKLFQEADFRLIFMGGSAMLNREAPNYLTHIDYFSTRNFKNIRSINLAESGARHMNMSVRFQREVIPLKPNMVIFFDGFNEFNSVVYGGNPGDDFYWTAGVKTRVHQPWRLYIDKMIEISAFFELSLLRTGIYKSSRVNIGKIDLSEIEKASNIYLQDVKTTRSICEAYSVICVFIIQPSIFQSKISEHQEIIKNKDSRFNGFSSAYNHGYKLIIDGCDFCFDASKVLENKEETFIDPVHFSKKGSLIVGQMIEKLVEKVYKN